MSGWRMIDTETFTGIRPFIASDMVWIVEDGIKEYGLKALGNDNIKELAENREANGQCLTAIVNDKIVGCGGVDLMYYKGVGEVWLLLSYEVDKCPIRAYEVIRDGLDKLIKDNGLWRAEAWCRVGLAKAHTLLRHLGFKVEGKARKRAPDKTDLILYAKVKG